MATQSKAGFAERRRQSEDLQRDDKGAGHAPHKSKKQLDRELDKELMDTFPTSDPPSSSQPSSPEPAGDPDAKP